MANEKRIITEIDAYEVSLVDYPAIGEDFVIIKSKNLEMDGEAKEMVENLEEKETPEVTETNIEEVEITPIENETVKTEVESTETVETPEKTEETKTEVVETTETVVEETKEKAPEKEVKEEEVPTATIINNGVTRDEFDAFTTKLTGEFESLKSLISGLNEAITPLKETASKLESIELQLRAPEKEETDEAIRNSRKSPVEQPVEEKKEESRTVEVSVNGINEFNPANQVRNRLKDSLIKAYTE